MKALVTGATGFVGSHLVDELIGRGARVTCLVRDPSRLRWLEGKAVDVFRGDCAAAESLEGLPSDFDFIFHLAGLTKAARDEDFFAANVIGTENILRAAVARRAGLQRFIHVSSLAAAGPSRTGGELGEDDAPCPVSVYGKSKLGGESAAFSQRARIPVTILRPPAVYGPRDRDFFLFFQMVKRGFYPYWGKCYYSLLYVDDLVKGIIAAAESPETIGEVYFLSDGGVYSNEEIVREIAEALSVRPLKLVVPKALMSLTAKLGRRLSKGADIISEDKLRELAHTHWVCNSRKAERDFGFAAKIRLKEGMKWTADWYRIHQWL